MGVPVIRELKGEEKWELRHLWEEVFTEDKGAFADYYFRYKIGKNECIVVEEQEADIKAQESHKEWQKSVPVYPAMLHLTPYCLMIRCGSDFQCITAPYIVGVATKKEYRHRGLMRMLLQHTIKKLFHRKTPFAFLMPADPAIYQPFDFVYGYSRQEYEYLGISKLKAASLPFYQITTLKREELPELLEFVNHKLMGQYDVFVKRDQAYYELQIKELEAMQGEIRLIRRNGILRGYYLIAMEDKEQHFIQEAWLPEENCKELPIIKAGDKPIIMMRITNVKAALNLLRTKLGAVECRLKIEDNLLTEQEGIYHCCWKEDSAVIEPGNQLMKQQDEPAIDAIVSISQLAEWMFGRGEVESCFTFTEKGKKKAEELKRVAVLPNVYINEIV